VVADWAATLERWDQWAPRVAAAGHKVAVVAQDGATPATVPWHQIDAVFIGGSTTWKLGADAIDIMGEAQARGVWVHVGRVNSRRRLRWAAAHGANSVDGTLLTWGPDKHLAPLLAWLREVNTQGVLL